MKGRWVGERQRNRLETSLNGMKSQGKEEERLTYYDAKHLRREMGPV